MRLVIILFYILLIEIDFDHLYPNKKICLFQKFETFKDKLKTYLNKKCINICSQGIELMEKLNNPLMTGKFNL